MTAFVAWWRQRFAGHAADAAPPAPGRPTGPACAPRDAAAADSPAAGAVPWGLLVAAHGVALWPVVQWYALRIGESDGDAWGIAALTVAVWFCAAARPPARRAGIGAATAALVVYATASPFVPPLVGAALGMVSLVALVSALRFGTRIQPALLALCLASLPSVASLQFFVGWPFRVAVAAVVAPVLRGLGIDAVREGTSLVVAGRAIEVDAPCSGVWLLWGALILWFATALARRLTLRGVVAGVAVVLPVVFAANGLRTVSLILLERAPAAPAWAHSAVGVIVLAVAFAAVVLLSERLARCAQRPST